MAIPLIQIPGLGHTPVNMPTPSAQALGATGAGLGEVARGIAQIGGALGAHADRVQGMENAYQESEARQKIAADMAELDQQLARNSDPASYAKLLDATLTKTKSYTQDPALSPIVREKLALAHGDMAANAQIKIAERAASMTAKRASLALQNEMAAAYEYGDQQSFTAAGQRGIDAGLILPEQFAAEETKFAQKVSYDSMVKAIEADPETALEQIQSEDFSTHHPDITPENADRLTKYASQQKHYKAAETWDGITAAALNGTYLSKEDVLSMVNDGDISAAEAGSYLRAYHQPAPPEFDPVIFDQARAAITAYDPAKDESGATRATLAAQIATIALPPEHVKELQSQFKARINPESQDAPKHKLAADYEARIDSEWKAEAFGNWFEMKPDPADARIARKVITEKDFDAALSYKTQVKDYFNAWLANQPATLDPLEAGKKYDEIKSTVLKKQAPADISLPSLAPLPTFDDPLDGAAADGAPGVLPNVPADPKTSSVGTFGGQPIPPPGVFIKRAATSIFGGNADPADNGLSANGGSNNDVAGVAIPEKMLKAMFPGKSKDWHFQNVKIVVKADNGLTKTLPLRDYGTAEWVTEREQNHKLDLNPKAVAALGGQAIFRNGKLVSHTGFKTVDFAITTDNAANMDPKTTDKNTLKSAWFKDKRPTHPDQVESGLAALLDAQALAALD